MAGEDALANWPFVPDPWKAAPEKSQDMVAPSHATKEVAKRSLVIAEVQQATGWLLLTHFGIILGSFGSMMSRSTFWLSWSIFILEALFKLVRSWLQHFFFRDVPCAYVPFHQQYVPFAFGLYAQMGASFVELGLYLPSWILFIRQWINDKQCYLNQTGCKDGVQRLIEVLLAACAITLLHLLSGLLAILVLIRAIGVPNEEALRYVTWWVHLSRHSHLSAAAASAQPEVCGLPGHWFQSVERLKESLKESLVHSVLSNTHGPTMACVQVMAMRALLGLCKESDGGKKVLENKGFDLLLEAIRKGRMECKGLAAATIGVLANQNDLIKNAEVQMGRAVPSLKDLLKSDEADFRELALGALVNVSLLREQRDEVLLALVRDDAMLNETAATFVKFLIEQARSGPTCLCQELATSLLVQLVNHTSARNAMLDGENGAIGLFSLMVQTGQTPELQAVAAGFLWELAYRARVPQIQLGACVKSLVGALSQEHSQQVAPNAAGALASLGYKNKAAKELITEAGAIARLVDMLKEPKGQVQACRALWILADNNPENQARMRQANAIPLLAQLLKKDDPDILVQAAWAISRLAFKCIENQGIIGSPSLHIIPSLVRLLKMEDIKKPEVIWEKAALALAEIARNHQTNQERIVQEEGAVEALVSLLRPDIKRQRVPVFAARALQMLAEGSVDDARIMVKEKARPSLLRLEGAAEGNVKEAATKALQALDVEI